MNRIPLIEILSKMLKGDKGIKSKDLLIVNTVGAINIYGPERVVTDPKKDLVAVITAPQKGTLKVQYYPAVSLPYEIVLSSVIEKLVSLDKVEFIRPTPKP